MEGRREDVKFNPLDNVAGKLLSRGNSSNCREQPHVEATPATAPSPRRHFSPRVFPCQNPVHVQVDKKRILFRVLTTIVSNATDAPKVASASLIALTAASLTSRSDPAPLLALRALGILVGWMRLLPGCSALCVTCSLICTCARLMVTRSRARLSFFRLSVMAG